MTATVTLQIPDLIYQRLVNTANATGRSLEEVMLHALKVGSPPDWDNVPDEFKADLAALDRLEDEALWRLATARKTSEEMARYDELLDRNQNVGLTQAEQLELMELRSQADRFMLCKAQAAALLHWRGHHVPNS
jgi:paraquat-inducible protein B